MRIITIVVRCREDKGGLLIGCYREVYRHFSTGRKVPDEYFFGSLL